MSWHHIIVSNFYYKEGFGVYFVASMGVSEGKAIGEWFGPNTVAQVLRYQ